MEDKIVELIVLLEERVSTMEEITAHLFNGYVEIATMVESLIAQVVKPLEPEAAAAFAADMTTHRQQMMSMVRDVAATVVPDPADDAGPVEDVVS